MVPMVHHDHAWLHLQGSGLWAIITLAALEWFQRSVDHAWFP